MNGVSPLKHGFVDLAAVLFVIGGVVSLVLTLLSIPITSLYPISLPSSFSMGFVVVLAIGLVCSLGAIHCYTLTMRRLLSEAGMRGMIFGALLLILSLGIFGSFSSGGNFVQATSGVVLIELSAVLILLGGVICFSLRHTNVSASSIAQQRRISQPILPQAQ
jgi:hypothetical protein